LVDLFGEAHAQHFVGLIKDNVLQVGQVQGTLVDVVDYATWGTNDYLGATAQAVELRAVWRAAVHWQNGEVRQVLGVGSESLGYLEGQLAGWSQNQDLRGLGWTIGVSQFCHAGQGRKCESSGLTGTGLSQTDNVAAFEKQWDGCCLDWRWLFVAKVGKRCKHAGIQTKFGEEHSWLFWGLVVVGVYGHVRRHEELPHSFGDRPWPSQKKRRIGCTVRYKSRSSSAPL